jgi:hypothetical protein
MIMAPELKKSIAEYVIGERKEVTISGSPLVVSVIYEAARASRNLMLALKNGNIDSISSAIEEKRVAVSRYEKVFGADWNL